LIHPLKPLPTSHPNRPEQTRLSSYRPDIDGLRALAIIAVLIYHIDERLLPGGFVGVDVFFVISGFLISAIIARDLHAGTFSIAQFYDRRIRRIVPALVAMICAVLAASWFILLPQDMEALGKSVRYVVPAMSNIQFLRNTEDYFRCTNNQFPLLHTWSLGVEEQFYLVFPLLLGALYRWRKQYWSRAAPLLILFVASLAASAWVVPNHPMKAFFLLPYRAWEMLLGALASLLMLPIPRGRSNHILGIIGLGMILASMAFFSNDTPFPGPSALLPCVGAALLLWTGQHGTSLTYRMLSIKPWVVLGLISYSVYLWHWPLIALANYRLSYTWTAKVVIFLASLIGGYLSWRYIENPFRNARLGSRKKVFALWGITSVLLLGAAWLLEHTKGFPNRFSPEVMHFHSFRKKTPVLRKYTGNQSHPEVAPVLGHSGVKPKFALWGDSHAMAIVPGLEALATEHGEAFKVYGLLGLAPVVGVVRNSDKDPEALLRYSQAVLNLLVADPSIQTVILHSRWSCYTEGKNEALKSSEPSLYGHHFQSKDDARNFYESQIKLTIEALLAAGKKIVLIYPVPEVGFNVPDLLAKQAAAGTQVASTVPCNGFFKRQEFIMKVLDSLGRNNQISRIKPHEKLLQDDMLTIRVGQDPLYADDDHLSDPGALYLKSLLSAVFTSSEKTPVQ